MKAPTEFEVDEGIKYLNSPIFDDEARELHTEDIRIDMYNLNNCLIKQADIMMTYSSNYELASQEEFALKEALERAYAVLDPQARIMLQSSGQKTTEATVDATIIANDEYVALQTKYLAAKKNAGQWKAARDSVIHRKDMLVQLAANYRAENMGEITLKDNIKNAREVLKKQ